MVGPDSFSALIAMAASPGGHAAQVSSERGDIPTATRLSQIRGVDPTDRRYQIGSLVGRLGCQECPVPAVGHDPGPQQPAVDIPIDSWAEASMDPVVLLDPPYLEMEHRLIVSGEILDDFGEVSRRPGRIQDFRRSPQGCGPRREDGPAGAEVRQCPAKCRSFAVAGGLAPLPEGFVGSSKRRHGTLDTQVRQGIGRPLANGGVRAVQQVDQHVSRPRMPPVRPDE
ncbi:hypothetical protein KPATCC21470_0339 [Kitasatospora purpeofusca]